MTYTSLVLPDVFIDDDGVLVSHDWTFPDGVRVGAGTPVRTDDFSTVSSTVENPIVAWDTPGNKTVTLLVTDDDGSQAILLEIQQLRCRCRSPQPPSLPPQGRWFLASPTIQESKLPR